MDLSHSSMGVPTHLWKSFNGSFNGFTDQEIYSNLWEIEHHSLSTTVRVKPEIFDHLTNELLSRYGPPQNHRRNGQIFRTVMPDILKQVTITCYPTTNVLSVQGAPHLAWVDSVLTEIGHILVELETEPNTTSATCATTPEPTSSVVNFSLNYDVNFPPLPTQSLPPTKEIGTQTELCICPCSCKTKRKAHKNKQVKSTVTSASHAPHRSNSKTMHQQSTSSISTKNRFDILEIEETLSDEADQSPPSSSTPQASPIRQPSAPPVADMTPEHKPSAPPLSDMTPEPQQMSPVLPSAPPVSEMSFTTDIGSSPAPQPSPKIRPQKSTKPSRIPRPIPVPPTKSTKPSRIPRPIPVPSTKAPCVSPATPNPPTIPNDTSKSSTKRTFLIIGDSIPKHLQGNRMSRRHRIINRCIPGTNIDFWKKFGPLFVDHYDPDYLIIHLGTNDINNTFPIECIKFLRELIKCLLYVKSSLHIVISGLTTQHNVGHKAWIREFNARIFEICQKQCWHFIQNDSIKDSHLTNDGLHLNMSGVKRLAQNFIQTIRDVQVSVPKDFQHFPVIPTVK